MTYDEKTLNRLTVDLIRLMENWALWGNQGNAIYCCGLRYADCHDSRSNRRDSLSPDSIWICDHPITVDHLSTWLYDDLCGKPSLYHPRIDPKKHILSMTFDERMNCVFNGFPIEIPWDELGEEAKDHFRRHYPEVFGEAEDDDLSPDEWYGISDVELEDAEDYTVIEDDAWSREVTTTQFSESPARYRAEPLFPTVTFDTEIEGKIFCGLRELLARYGLWFEWLTESSICAIPIGQMLNDLQLSNNKLEKGEIK